MSNNLNTFRILFLIKGILTLCFSVIFIVYAVFGVFMGNMAEFSNPSDPLPFNPGHIFLIIGMVGFIFSIAIGILALMASKHLKEISNYNFIIVAAGINGITGILGILLAAFTIIELSKPEIKALFNK